MNYCFSVCLKNAYEPKEEEDNKVLQVSTLMVRKAQEEKFLVFL